MIHICYGLYDSDGRYSKFVGTSILSIFENTNKDITIHILHDNTLTNDNRDKFNYLAGHYNQQIKFYNVEIIAADKILEYKSGIPALEKSPFSIASIYRLLIFDILSDSINKIIYLDADTLVNRNINDLWSIELNDYPLAAFPEFDCGLTYTVDKYLINANLIKTENYFNSGVLLINLEYWRQHRDLINEGYKFIQSHPECIFFDQDLLNYCFSENYIKLSIDFNRYVDIERLLKRADITRRSIYHFLSSSLEVNMSDVLNKLYFEYFVKTPWFNFETLINIFNSFHNMYNEKQGLLMLTTKIMSGRTRAFFVENHNAAVIKNMFNVMENEVMIDAEPVPQSVETLINFMNMSPNKTLVFILLSTVNYDIVKNLLIQNNFVETKDFIDGRFFLQAQEAVPFKSHFIVKAM